ncbi:unnamed protein product [Diamesa serratosioi]
MEIKQKEMSITAIYTVGNLEKATENKLSTDNSNIPVDFETAIAATGYGKFNYIMLLIAIPCCFGSVFETTTMSLILPSAECDLNLSLIDKGILNAITYCGMISSAVLWGFLSDILGRKKLLIFGYLLDGVVNIMCSLSQSFVAIMIFKFIGGFIICGPFAVLMSYLSEFHGLKYRSRVMMSTGMFFSIANIMLPLLAWFIIPKQHWNITVIEGYFELHTWQLFLMACSLPSLISGFAVMLLPESPKFLMSRGYNDAAMKVFNHIHKVNNGNNVEYSVKCLINEKVLESKDSSLSANQKPLAKLLMGIRNGFSQMSCMLEPPHFRNACLVYTIQFCILFGLNTFRLWVPQLFAIITEYEKEHSSSNDTVINSNLCDMIEYKVNKTQQTLINLIDGADGLICEPTLESDMYLNSLLISVITLFGYVMASIIINAVGNKNLLIYGLLISGTCGIALKWAPNSTATLLLAAGNISIGSISSSALVSSIVSMFPTATRTMNVSLAMMFGRGGAIIGNLLFPWLMSLGCLPPFMMIGATAIICSAICTLLPKTIRKPLQ